MGAAGSVDLSIRSSKGRTELLVALRASNRRVCGLNRENTVMSVQFVSGHWHRIEESDYLRRTAFPALTKNGAQLNWIHPSVRGRERNVGLSVRLGYGQSDRLVNRPRLGKTFGPRLSPSLNIYSVPSANAPMEAVRLMRVQI